MDYIRLFGISDELYQKYAIQPAYPKPNRFVYDELSGVLPETKTFDPILHAVPSQTGQWTLWCTDDGISVIGPKLRHPCPFDPHLPDNDQEIEIDFVKDGQNFILYV